MEFVVVIVFFFLVFMYMWNLLLILFIGFIIVLLVKKQENFDDNSIKTSFDDIFATPTSSGTTFTSYDDNQIKYYLVNVINSLNLTPEVPDVSQQKQIFLDTIIKTLKLTQTLAQLDGMKLLDLKAIIDPVLTTKLDTEKAVMTNYGKDFLAQLEQTNQKDISNMFATDIDDNSTFMQYVKTNIDNITNLQRGIHDSKNAQYQARIKAVQDKISGFRSLLDNETRIANVIKQIISIQNGLKLTVLPVANNRYIVLMNDKCLSTNEVNRYTLETCKHNDIKQHFYVIPVYTKTEYQKYLKVPQKDTNVTYPFYLVSSVSNDNCLTNNNNNITIEPCGDDVRQRWKISDDLLVCK